MSARPSEGNNDSVRRPHSAEAPDAAIPGTGLEDGTSRMERVDSWQDRGDGSYCSRAVAIPRPIVAVIERLASTQVSISANAIEVVVVVMYLAAG